MTAVLTALDKDTQTLVALLDNALQQDEQDHALFDKRVFTRRLDMGEMLEILQDTLKGKFASFCKQRWGESKVRSIFRCLRVWTERFKIMSEAQKRGKTYPDEVGFVEALEWIKEARPGKEDKEKKATEYQERLKNILSKTPQTHAAQEVLSNLQGGMPENQEEAQEVAPQVRSKAQELLAKNTARQREVKEDMNQGTPTPMQDAKVWDFRIGGELRGLDCEPSYLESGLKTGDITLLAVVDGNKVVLKVTTAKVEARK